MDGYEILHQLGTIRYLFFKDCKIWEKPSTWCRNSSTVSSLLMVKSPLPAIPLFGRDLGVGKALLAFFPLGFSLKKVLYEFQST